jgi:hypothetical protein
MQADRHYPVQWMHHEGAAVGRWCSDHLVHDYHVWLYLLIVAVVIALIALRISIGSGTVLDHELRYYAYPYGQF